MDRIFNKQCNVSNLTNELKSAGFDIFGVSNSGNTTIIHLKDTELKNPETIVNNHIYTVPLTPEQRKTNEIAAFLVAPTINDKVNLIAKKLGLL